MDNTKLILSCICRSVLTTDFSVEFWQTPWLFIVPFDSIPSITRPLVTAADNHCECTEIMTSTNTILSGFHARSSFTLDTKNMFGPVNLHWQKKKEVTFRTTHLSTCLLFYSCVSCVLFYRRLQNETIKISNFQRLILTSAFLRASMAFISIICCLLRSRSYWSR